MTYKWIQDNETRLQHSIKALLFKYLKTIFSIHILKGSKYLHGPPLWKKILVLFKNAHVKCVTCFSVFLITIMKKIKVITVWNTKSIFVCDTFMSMIKRSCNKGKGKIRFISSSITRINSVFWVLLFVLIKCCLICLTLKCLIEYIK